MSHRWPIKRRWGLVGSRGERRVVDADALSTIRACSLLGAAGLGKTFELQQLAEAARKKGLDVRLERLAHLGQTADSLRSRLDAIADKASDATIIFLDALDEVMIPIRTAAEIVRRWILESVAQNRPYIRISCRSSVWPREITAAFQQVFGEDDGIIAQLQPLDDDEVSRIASEFGLDASAFGIALNGAKARSLSQQPLTLEMLMKVYKGSGRLPQSRSLLFQEGVEILADERIERREIGTNAETPTSVLLNALERLACASLLSGRTTIDLGDWPTESCLGRRELERLAGEPNLSYEILRDAGRCGLCESDGSSQFRFAHRQFAEYLAGRRLAMLLPHQAKSLLSTGMGWQAGVSGPLRETAAFAAMFSTELAEWVAECDSEVIGLSDVADSGLRKRATINLLEKFRTHELTDSQVGRSITELNGFYYAGAEADLSSVLSERQPGCEDVLELAIELAESWGLTTLSDDLATLMLDSSAPLESRKAAGYALLRIGTSAARKRLLPLAIGVPEDAAFDLKGLALKCNWPESVSVSELLDLVVPESQRSYHGAYAGFLFDLQRTGFDASDDILKGLRWAKQFVGRDKGFRSTGRIATQIAMSALSRMSEPGVTDALAELLLAAAGVHAPSPIAPEKASDADESSVAMLTESTIERQALIASIVFHANDESAIWSVAHDSPGLLDESDFLWLLDKATDESIPMQQREHFAQLGRMLPWADRVENVDAWLVVREIEPIASHFPTKIEIALDSKEAEQAKKSYALTRRPTRKLRRKKVRPSPVERIEEVLVSCKTKDVRFFYNLCRELTLEEYSTHFEFERFLTRSPGWAKADEPTRQRILDAARSFLLSDTDDPETARTKSLNSILSGPMQAMWLLLECEATFLRALPPTWWSRWAWYILRELHFTMMDETEEPKAELLRLLYNKAPESVRTEVCRLAMSKDDQSKALVEQLLDALVNQDDEVLDSELCRMLSEKNIAHDRISKIAQFLLIRRHATSSSACLRLIEPRQLDKQQEIALEVFDALMQQRIGEHWNSIYECLSNRPELTRPILERFATGSRLRRSDDDTPFTSELSFAQIGQFTSLLIKTFPFEDDPVDDGGAHFLGSSDMAKRLRGQLINWLGSQHDFEAVEAMRRLEREFGSKYSWLRRPRAQVERNYRLSVWNPVPTQTIGELLDSNDRRLMRSASDVADGLVASLEAFATSLRHESPNALEDLWVIPKKGKIEPRPEDRISEKICAAVRRYFDTYALTADREVQVFRRKSPKSKNGAPGSEVDVMCRVPATGATNGDPITVPIEVKLAHNPEASTGLQKQLVDRYMSEVGTNTGIFVVVWMGNQKSPHRPKWKSIDDAHRELTEQARELSSDERPIDLRIVVIDASLPLAEKRLTRITRKKKGSTAKRSKKRIETHWKKPAKSLKKRRSAKPKSPRSGALKKKRKK